MRMFYNVQGMIAVLSCITPFALAQLQCEPHDINFFSSSDATTVTISDTNGAHVKFKYAGAQNGFGSPVQPEYNFIIVVPSSGTTPATVQIAVNPNVFPLLTPSTNPSLFVNFTTVDQTPASTVSANVTLRVPPEPPPAIQSVVNAASLQPALSPGTLVSIFGSSLVTARLSTSFDDTGQYPTSVAGTSISFNGVAAPLLYVSPSQINAIVPFSLAGQTNASIVVQGFQRGSIPVTVPLQDTAPAIFTSSQTGTGQAAILQQAANGPISHNSPNNPAVPGEYLEIFGTGEGPWNQPPQSDLLIFAGKPPTIALPVSLTIGGQPATIVYAGPMGGLSTWSVFQINAIVPNGLSPGDQPVVLKIGAHDNSQQKVTVAVQ